MTKETMQALWLAGYGIDVKILQHPVMVASLQNGDGVQALEVLCNRFGGACELVPQDVPLRDPKFKLECISMFGKGSPMIFQEQPQ